MLWSLLAIFLSYVPSLLFRNVAFFETMILGTLRETGGEEREREGGIFERNDRRSEKGVFHVETELDFEFVGPPPQVSLVTLPCFFSSVVSSSSSSSSSSFSCSVFRTDRKCRSSFAFFLYLHFRFLGHLRQWGGTGKERGERDREIRFSVFSFFVLLFVSCSFLTHW